MDAVNFIAAARIRVLLVPVGPIKKATFERHAKMLRQHNSVKLEEVSMGPRTENSFFSQSVPHEGQLYFHFVTSYSSEHQYLEEFQMHRRVFGVIGIMDCQEWPDGNMAPGYQQFQQLLAKYPSAVANQCFAFDPTEHQPDDPRGGGVIMIPNVGNTSFYLRVLICDIARTVLGEFENIAATLGKRQDIESPNPAVALYPNRQGQHSGPNSSGPSGPQIPEMSAGMKPLTAPPSAMTTHGSSNHSRSLSSTGFPSVPTTSQYQQPTVVTDQRLRKRTAARAQKLYGDLYLMAGRLSDAVASYQAVIEVTKSNSDFLWQGSAMEGMYCAVVLLAYLQADMSQLNQQQLQQLMSSPTSPTTSEPTRIQNTPAIKPLIVDIPEKYQTILSLYGRVLNNGTPAILVVEACMKVTKFIATCFICGNGILDDRALAAVVSGNILMNADGTAIEHQPLPMTQSPSSNQSSMQSGASGLLRRASTLRSRPGSLTPTSVGVNRADVMTWISKTWTGRLEELWIIDQIHFTTTIASILGAIQFKRKQSLYLRYAVRMLAPLLHQARLAQAATQAGGLTPRKASHADHGVLEILTQVCNVFGVGDNFASSNNLYMDHGWPELQIDVLYECIRIAEAVPDYSAMMYFSTTLLRQLYAYLTREEQAGLYASLPRILTAAKKSGVSDLAEIQYWTKTLILDIEVCSASARRMPYTRTKDSLKSIIPAEPAKVIASATGDVDPFIYNPFHRKVNQTAKQDLVADETAHFIVTLTNPHAIEIEIQEIRLSTSGVEFEAAPTSTVIPAQTTVSIKVAGVPKSAGELQIRGCWVQIAHCAEQEFLVHRHPAQNIVEKAGGASGPSAVSMPRFKKRGLESFTLKNKASPIGIVAEPKFTTIKVIPPQPLLKISSTSLQHGSVMLFEGEKTTIRLTLENIGNIPVDFVTLTFSDSTSQLTVGGHGHGGAGAGEMSAEDAYELEFFLKKLHVFSWNRDVECHIPVGGSKDIKVEVLGKRGCSSGMVQIDYGYLNRTTPEGEESTVLVTRQLFSQVLMTVYKTVECLNLDVLYLQSHGGMDIPPTEPNTPLLDHGNQSDSPEVSGAFSNNDDSQNNHRDSTSSLPRIDFSNDGFLAPPNQEGEGTSSQTKSIQIQAEVKPGSSHQKSYSAGRRGSRTINKRLSSNFARVDKRQSVEQLLSKARGDANLPGEQIEAAISRRVALGTKNEYCLLTMDVRNVWTVPVEVAMLVDDSEDGEEARGHDGDAEGYAGFDLSKLIKSTTVIQPGSTQRIILPVRRMVLSTEQLARPIPTLSNKQFVVSRSATGQTSEEQATERALYWFREELLKRVVARWTCKDNASGRFGKFDLRALRLSRAMLNVLKIEDISFLVKMEQTEAVLQQGAAGDSGEIKKGGLEQIGSNRWRCPVEQFAQIRFTVVNRSHKDVKLCLRMQPVQVHGDGTMEYDLGSRMVWHGVLQAPLAKMGPDMTTSHILPVCFYSRGEYKVLYHAEDVRKRVVYYDHEPLVIEAF
ncbi:hypothetical protein BGW38_000039 [Lunasporangiospora selenospora]|uniref:Uncharacterized protein n=1 Tax=Lunasporangiospora selenospora TaxID=979761 RepID=A0A9P6KF48_9FUNG|nr:hypothetical protein BGW38_000039 [Lunasporangiospora selenospora]